MKREDLYEKYKQFFTGSRNIEVPDGWLGHVESLLENLVWTYNNNTHKPNPNYNKEIPMGEGNFPAMKDNDRFIKIDLIKEKFGSLRVHFIASEGLKWSVERSINVSEGKCQLTCMECGRIGEPDGKPIKINRQGWIGPICDKCKKEVHKQC